MENAFRIFFYKARGITLNNNKKYDCNISPKHNHCMTVHV